MWASLTGPSSRSIMVVSETHSNLWLYGCHLNISICPEIMNWQFKRATTHRHQSTPEPETISQISYRGEWKKRDWTAWWSTVVFKGERKLWFSFWNHGSLFWMKYREAQNPSCLWSIQCWSTLFLLNSKLAQLSSREFSQQDSASPHNAKTTSTWLNDHGITAMDFPCFKVHRESMEFCQEKGGIQMKLMKSLRPLSKLSVLPLHISSDTCWGPSCCDTLM